MDTTIEQQAAMDEALVPHAQRDMLHIFPRVHGQSFTKPPFEEEILAFISFLGHIAAIKTLTDPQTISSLNSVGIIPQEVIIHHLMSKDLSIPRRNKVKWHYVRDDHMFSTIKLVSRHQNTQQFSALLPIELINEEIRNSNAYKEYYVISTGVAQPKPKASVRRTQSSSDTSITPPTTAAAMTEAQQLKLVTKRSMQQTHISHASGSGVDEGTGKDGDDDEEDEGDDGEESNDDDEQEVERDDNKDDEEEGSGEEDIGLNVSGEEGHVEEEEEDELYRDVNINQGRGLQMTHKVKDSHATLTPINPDGQQQSSSVSSQFVTILSNIIQNLPNFGSLFRFDDRLRSLEANFSEAMHTNQFASAVSAIPKIVQRFMDQQMNEAVNVAVQIQSDHLREEAQRENDKFLKTVDENMQKIIKEQVKEQVKVQVSKILSRIEQTVNEQLEAEVLTRSSYSSRTSYVVAADLSETELKKILIEKIKGNKSIQRSDEQRNLYKAPVEAYEFDKIILDTYGETVTLKRRRDDDANKDEEPSDGPDRGSKRRREGKKPESASAPSETATRSAGRSTQGSRSRKASASESTLAEEPMQTTSQIEEPSHPDFDTGAKDQPIVQSSHHLEWFSQQQKPPSLDRDWNKTVPAIHGSIQPWITELAKQTDSHSSFNELMDTPLDFSNFLINRLKVDTLTPELLAGPTYELMKGSCKSLVELEYHLEEVFKAIADQLDWVNLEGQQYPHNLLKPLPLIPNNRVHRVIPFEHFINNNLEYLCGGASSHKYTTFIMKTKAADYGRIKWIVDLGRKRQQFYGFVVNRESAHDVYSKRRIIAVTELKIVEWQNYKHLDWITARRDNDKLYKFKEGDFKRLCIQDIEDMLLLLVQGKLTNLTVEERFAFNISLRMFTRSIVIQRRVEDLQPGVESYQKKLNLTKPDSSILTDLQVTPTKPGRMIKPYSSHHFIANCFNAGNLKIETDMMKLVVEIECFGMSVDEFDKETRSSDGLQPKQAHLSCVHALNEPHLCEIHVVPNEPMLGDFVDKLKSLKKDVEADCPNPPSKNKTDNLEQLVRVLKPPVVEVNNPTVGSTKGRKKLHIKRGKEKTIEKSLKGRNSCSLCGGTDHNKRTPG
nr:protein FAR1-related sequence 5 [Tanacetum cinerariifolium]